MLKILHSSVHRHQTISISRSPHADCAISHLSYTRIGLIVTSSEARRFPLRKLPHAEATEVLIWSYLADINKNKATARISLSWDYTLCPSANVQMHFGLSVVIQPNLRNQKGGMVRGEGDDVSDT